MSPWSVKKEEAASWNIYEYWYLQVAASEMEIVFSPLWYLSRLVIFSMSGTKDCKNAIITFAMFVCPYIHTKELENHNGFSRNLALNSFNKRYWYIPVLVTIQRQ